MTTKSNAAVLPSTFGQRLKNDMRRNWVVYLMLLPVIAFFFIFNYRVLFTKELQESSSSSWNVNFAVF